MARLSDQQLDEARQAGDPITDSLVRSLADPGPLTRWIADQGPAPDTLRPWLVATAALPPDVDLQRLERGQRVFSRIAPAAMLALLCRGLPECYAGADGATLLMLSGRIAASPRRRIMETARFVLAVMEPGRLERATVEAQKVRIVHGFARRHIARSPGYHPRLGVPVNQEDMLGTLLAFSWLVVDSMPRLGVALSESDAEDYLYAWRVVGWLTGVDPALLPHRLAEADAQMAQIRRRHFRASPAGRQMTAALLEMLGELVVAPLPEGPVLSPARGLAARAPVAMMRWLMPGDLADLLGVPRAPDHRLWGGALYGVGRLTSRAMGAGRPELWEPLGRAIFETVYRYGSDGETPVFAAPGAQRAA